MRSLSCCALSARAAPCCDRACATSSWICCCSRAIASAWRSASSTSRPVRADCDCCSCCSACFSCSIALGGRGRGVRIAVGRRLPHRVGGLLQLPRRLLQLRTILFARQLLELPRRFFGLIGERALRVAAALALPLPRRAGAAARLPAPGAAPAPSASRRARRSSDRPAAATRAARSRTGWPSCRLRARTGRRAPRPSSGRRRHRRHPAAAASTPAARTPPPPSAGPRAPCARAAAPCRATAACSLPSAVCISGTLCFRKSVIFLKRSAWLPTRSAKLVEQLVHLLAQPLLHQADDDRALCLASRRRSPCDRAAR